MSTKWSKKINKFISAGTAKIEFIAQIVETFVALVEKSTDGPGISIHKMFLEL